MCIYVLDGDFLMLGLRKELHRLSKDFICSTYAIDVNNPIIGLSDQCQFRKVSMFKVDENHGIINSMYDFDTKFKYVSTIRGMVVNRSIDQKGHYFDSLYLSFCFYMAFYCQVFREKYGVFNQESKSCVELINSIGRVEYESRFDLCRDGNVRSIISYDCLSKKKITTAVGIQDEELLKDVYKSPIIDIDVDMIRESNGYYPNGKSMYGENILYDKTKDAHHYENRGLKHLYEGQHVCKSKDGYCNLFCKSHLSGRLDSFFKEREELDLKSKLLSFSTLIPPPYIGESKTISKVFVTEINSDLSCNFISPNSIQDPTYMNYDKDMLQVRLDDPYFNEEGNFTCEISLAKVLFVICSQQHDKGVWAKGQWFVVF